MVFHCRSLDHRGIVPDAFDLQNQIERLINADIHARDEVRHIDMRRTLVLVRHLEAEALILHPSHDLRMVIEFECQLVLPVRVQLGIVQMGASGIGRVDRLRRVEADMAGRAAGVVGAWQARWMRSQACSASCDMAMASIGTSLATR